jgi:hypothetical protein
MLPLRLARCISCAVLAGPTSTGSPLLSHCIFPKGVHPSSLRRHLGNYRQVVLGCLAQGWGGPPSAWLGVRAAAMDGLYRRWSTAVGARGAASTPARERDQGAPASVGWGGKGSVATVPCRHEVLGRRAARAGEIMALLPALEEEGWHAWALLDYYWAWPI